MELVTKSVMAYKIWFKPVDKKSGIESKEVLFNGDDYGAAHRIATLFCEQNPEYKIDSIMGSGRKEELLCWEID